MIIFTHLPEEFKEIRQISDEYPEKPVYSVEEEILGFDHAMVGSYLIQKWNLPEELAQAIKYHHNPEADIEDNLNTNIIHLSNYLSKKSEEDESKPIERNKYLSCSPIAWEKLGMKPDQEEQLIQLLRTEYMKAETFLNMARGG